MKFALFLGNQVKSSSQCDYALVAGNAIEPFKYFLRGRDTDMERGEYSKSTRLHDHHLLSEVKHETIREHSADYERICRVTFRARADCGERTLHTLPLQ